VGNSGQALGWGAGQPDARRAGNSPIILLSYAYSGARRVQEALTADTDLACTVSTGVIPLCDMAAETWRRVEGRDGQTLSPLALSSIRQMASTQVTTILAGVGKRRWCELATATPGTMVTFLQVFPHAAVVCVHRFSLDVIREGIDASSWGLQDRGLIPYVMAHPGNNVAALAAHWARSTEQLLAFEAANPAITHRIRVEDAASDSTQSMTTLRAALRVDKETQSQSSKRVDVPAQATGPGQAELRVPVELIPEPVRERITRLHAALGYPPLQS
jgi:hypothetical protein